MTGGFTSEQILKKYWGYDSFRGRQKEVIDSVLAGKDTLAVLPTGAGKSICYQVPAMMKNGVCVVIEPLISLIKDQIDNLKKAGINAVTVNSLQSVDSNNAALNQLYHYRSKILFIAAERLQNKEFHYHLRELRVNMVVIDEAHCISQWGHSFRPAYKNLGIIRDILPQAVILALTATATQTVRQDIVTSLRMQQPNIYCGSFYRENIFLQTEEVSDKIQKIVQLLQNIEGNGIIYCRKRADSVLIARKLKEKYNISALPYNANLTSYERTKAQTDWIEGRVRVIVATTAFGMGINKADVRFVIHYDIPPSLENFYQEFGRAGRDGKPAQSILLYNELDLFVHKSIAEMSYPEKNTVYNIYKILCSQYRISFSSGKGGKYPFNFDEFVLQTKESDTVVRNCLKILKNEGWVDFFREKNPQSKVKILVNNEELNRFVDDYGEYWYIIEILLRNYPAIHYDEAAVNEIRMARNGFTSESQVIKDLKVLHDKNIIRYTPKITGDCVVFKKDRPFSMSSLLSEEMYYIPRKSSLQKAEQIRKWVLSDKCRWKMIRGYFGEKSVDCNNCDNCKPSKI